MASVTVLAFIVLAGVIVVLGWRLHTERRRLRADNVTLQQLAQTRDRLSALVETAPVGIVSLDTEGRVLTWNREAERIFGWTDAEAIGCIPPFVKQEHHEEFLANVRTELHGPPFRGEELRRVRRDGSPVALLLNSAPLRDTSSGVVGIMGVMLDISALKILQQRLETTSRELAAIVESAPVAIIALDLEGRVRRWNPTAEQIFGWSEAEALGRLPPFLPAADEAEFRGYLAAHRPSAAGVGMERPSRRKDGSPLDIHIHSAPLLDDRGECTGILGMIADISDRKRAEERLRLAAVVFDGSMDAIFVTDRDGIIVAVNPMFVSLMGHWQEDILGQHISCLQTEFHDQAFYAATHESMLEKGGWSGEIILRRKNGAVFPAWMKQTAAHAPDGQLAQVVCAFSDISESKAASERIVQLAHYDAVTGLPNRILFRDRVEQMLSHAKRSGETVAVLFLDLDRFKIINDSLGHPVGDALLCEVSQRLSACVRAEDTVCRYGGDEFAFALPQAGNAEGGTRVARKLIGTFAEPFLIEGHSLVVTPSIGIALAPADGGDSDTLVRNADTAMYHAKERGRNNYQFFAAAMNAAAMERLTLEGDLRLALDRGELALHFQPLIDLATSRVIGLEALLRWHHPTHGLIPPTRFIPVAEDSGLILEIGVWVLNEACRMNRQWQDEGLPAVPVAVNVSVLQLRRGRFEQTVAAVLAATGLEARYLQLELTESLLMDQSETTLSSLQQLKASGVRLVIDDFGTGYSSLSYLRRFSIDKIKIDRSFIHDACNNSHDAAITRTIIAMGHSLGVHVLAEGVETSEQLELLRQAGCDEAQGNYFSEPVPMAAVPGALDPARSGRVRQAT